MRVICPEKSNRATWNHENVSLFTLALFSIYFSRLQVGAQRNRLQEFQYETKAERQRAYDDGVTETELNQACHNSLRNSHADLRNRYADLEARHAALQTSYADLQTGYADLQVRVKRLEDEIFSGP